MMFLTTYIYSYNVTFSHTYAGCLNKSPNSVLKLHVNSKELGFFFFSTNAILTFKRYTIHKNFSEITHFVIF